MTSILYFVIAAVVVALFVVALFWKPQPTKRAGSNPEAPSTRPNPPPNPPATSPVITVEYPELTGEKLAPRIAAHYSLVISDDGRVTGIKKSIPTDVENITADGPHFVAKTREPAAMPRKPKFEVYQDRKGAWRWRLRAANRRIVATGEGHTRKRDAERAARMVAETAGKAEVVEA